MRIVFAAVLVALSLSVWALAGDATITYTGTVTDAGGKPIPAARVILYELRVANKVPAARLVGETRTDAAGKFEIAGPKTDASDWRVIYLLALKDGYALGFAGSERDVQSLDYSMVLGKPAPLAGTVVDDSGAGVPDAAVGLLLIRGGGRDMTGILGVPGIEPLRTKTGSNGAFRFDNIPGDATAEFLVSAPGKAGTCTYQPAGGRELGTFLPGNVVVRIALAPEAAVEGMVVEKENGRPVAGITIIGAAQGPARNPFHVPSAVSAPDGSFRLGGFSSGTCEIGVVGPEKGLAEWVAARFDVSLETGKTASGVKVELEKGGIIEVLVTDEETKKPVDGVSIHCSGNVSASPGIGMRTEADGIARTRAPAGTYRVGTVWKEEYQRPDLQKIAALEVATGQTAHVDIELQSCPKITGIVIDDKGAPVAGAVPQLTPYYYGRGENRTGADGKFEIAWDSSQAPGEPAPNRVLVIDVSGRRAGVADLPDPSKPVEIRLEPAVTVSGRVTAQDGKAIAYAPMNVMVKYERGAWSVQAYQRLSADADGRYEYAALPRDMEYEIRAQADGYGADAAQVDLRGEKGASLQARDIVLAVADKVVAGKVVDGDGKPVEGANVSVYGKGQQHRSAVTDKDGKFKLEGLAAGQVDVNASKYAEGSNIGGRVHAQAGDENLEIVISGTGVRETPKPPEPVSLLGKPLPDLTTLSPDFAAAEGKIVLVAFFDSNQRPSRKFRTDLVARAGDLKARGVVIFGVDLAGGSAREPRQPQEVPFPVAAATDAEKTRIAFGVRGLPWLVLADKGHIVRAEGFPLDQLDAQLRK